MNAPLKLSPLLAPLLPSLLATPALAVEGLCIALDTGAEVVSDIAFTLEAGQILGLVGESGSGKTTIATALLAHVRKGARITAGSVWVAGHDMLNVPPHQLRRLRGKLVGHVAQDPATALNPLQRVGDALDEVLRQHQPALARSERAARIASMLDDVGLPRDAAFLRRYPHQLSGGQQQRILLALAFLPRPGLIVLDEATTALDVTTQARILETIRSLCSRYGAAAVYVSHDLAVVHQLADHVIVLYAGRIAESGPAARLFAHPAHPYTKGLLAAIPDIGKASAPRPIPGQAPAPGTRQPGCAFAPRCAWRADSCAQLPPLQALTHHQQVACSRPDALAAGAPVRFVDLAPAPPAAAALLTVRHACAWYGRQQVLFDASLALAPGECLAVVGESGSGKTTFARLLAGLGLGLGGAATANCHCEAEIRYGQSLLPLAARARSAGERREIQYIFQNPYRALNPRQQIGAILRSTLRQALPLATDGAQRIAAVLARVALQPHVLQAYPGALSGGERQRVAIARALLCEPRLLICDEITSALDVSVQAAILELLQQLQADGLAILFVTHNLGVVRSMASRVLVLRQGRIVEQGTTEQVLDRPQHAYTRALVGDSPSIAAFQPY